MWITRTGRIGMGFCRSRALGAEVLSSRSAASCKCGVSYAHADVSMCAELEGDRNFIVEAGHGQREAAVEHTVILGPLSFGAADRKHDVGVACDGSDSLLL
mmetsp:Transcript_3088/g.7439  ORF Transcript_3088/g.7439 Transcript_3088/m.7439 type:complete len:101 (-) Transcript_3088:7-309(-)